MIIDVFILMMRLLLFIDCNRMPV